MAPRYPNGHFKSLGNQTQPRLDTDNVVICLHTIVGSMKPTWEGWHRDGYRGLESTFLVGGRWGADGAAGLDGVVWQAQEITHTADANYHGSHRVISIETGDNAPRAAADIAPWTDRQVESITDLLVWLCRTLGVPPVLIPDTKPSRTGIGYHQQGCDPVRVAGGELWSKAFGKECPGPARIRQLKKDIIPAVQARFAGGSDVATTPDEWKALLKVEGVPVSDPDNANAGDPSQVGVRTALGWTADRSAATLRELAALKGRVTEIGSEVPAIRADLSAVHSQLDAIGTSLSDLAAAVADLGATRGN